MADKYWPEPGLHNARSIALDRHLILVFGRNVWVYHRGQDPDGGIKIVWMGEPIWRDEVSDALDLESEEPLEQRAHVRWVVRQLGYEPTPGGNDG